MKKYKDLSYTEKKIASRMYSKQCKKSKFLFPLMILIIVVSYYIYEYITKLILPVLLVIAVILYIINSINVKKWFDKNNIKISKKDILIFGTNYEIEKSKEYAKEKIPRFKNKCVNCLAHKCTAIVT